MPAKKAKKPAMKKCGGCKKPAKKAKKAAKKK
jgi:hypothetical protein